MSHLPEEDPNQLTKLNMWVRSPSLHRADDRPEAIGPDATPRIKMPLDRLSLILVVLVVIALALGVVWVLHTGGFGTPPPPTPVP